MRISDWSSDVCSSDLSGTHTLRGVLQLPEGDGPHPIVIMAHGQGGLKEWPNIPSVSAVLCAAGIATLAFDYRNFGDSDGEPRDAEIGRASCRERVCQDV